MKRVLLFVPALLCLALSSFAQSPVLLNNNKNLVSGYPISATKAIFIQQETDDNLIAKDSLWVTDGTPANTKKINVPVAFDRDGELLPWNGKMYFAGVTAANGSELWVTDGTDAGTHIVKDINAGGASSNPRSIMAYNGLLYFFADNGMLGQELWKSDGTDAGTTLVKDINTGGEGSALDHISYGYFNNELFFVAKSASGEEVWKTNGTTDGTVMLKDINPNGGSATPVLLKSYDNVLLFVANDGFHGMELWKTNGTAAGTEMVKDIFQGGGSSDINDIMMVNGKLVFVAANAMGNKELWTSNLTDAGTVLLKEIEAGPVGSNPDLTNGIFINNRIVFAATTTATGRELFYTDGTSAGTGLFKDLTPGPTSSAPDILLDNSFFSLGVDYDPNHVLYNGQIFFTTSANFVGKLWITDGTPGNTIEVKDFGPMSLMFRSHYYTQSGLYFSVNDPVAGYEIYKTKGTAASTNLYADINQGVPSSMPFFMFFMLNGKVFFSADNGDSEEGDRDLFVLGETENPLPLRLLNFGGVKQNTDVLLDWNTQNEINVRNFEIERSPDGRRFEKIGQLSAKGNTGEASYQWVDAQAVNQKSDKLFYRLKMVDNDGKFSYSPVILIRFEAANAELTLYPNPVKNDLRINFSGEKAGKLEGRIISSTGQVMQKLSFAVRPGSNQQWISTSHLPSGVYFIELQQAGEPIQTKRFIRQ